MSTSSEGSTSHCFQKLLHKLPTRASLSCRPHCCTFFLIQTEREKAKPPHSPVASRGSANLSPSDLQFSLNTVRGASALLWYQRPKDSDWSLKEKVFIFVPDCTEAYILLLRRLVVVRAAFSSDCSGLLSPRCVALKEAGCLKSHTF